MTRARSVAKLTVAVTPSILFSLPWTRAAHAAQVMPAMTSSNVAGGLVTAASATSSRVTRSPYYYAE